jgi:hypothetical protein
MPTTTSGRQQQKLRKMEYRQYSGYRSVSKANRIAREVDNRKLSLLKTGPEIA